jgi:hypothetical protein
VGEGVDFPHRSILATTPHPSSRRRRRPRPPLDEPAAIDEALALGDKLGEAANLQQQRDATIAVADDRLGRTASAVPEVSRHYCYAPQAIVRARRESDTGTYEPLLLGRREWETQSGGMFWLRFVEAPHRFAAIWVRTSMQ